MNDNNELDRLLNNRHVATPPSNLAHRISVAAQEKSKKAPLYGRLIQEISTMIYLPKPSYAFALVLVLGLFIGFQINPDEVMTSSEELFSFTQIEGEEWL